MLREVSNGLFPLLPLAVNEIPDINASDLGSSVLVIACLAVIVNQVWMLWQRATGKPVQMDIESSQTLLIKPLTQRLDHLEKDLDKEIGSNNERFGGLKEKIEKVGDELKRQIRDLDRKNQVRDQGLQSLYQDVLKAISIGRRGNG